MLVRDMMTPDPACCTSDTPLTGVARMMADCDCGEIPVVESDLSRVPIGVVTDRDIVCRAIANGLNPLDLTARDCMTEPIVTARADMSLEECCLLMEGNLIRRLPVVDDRGACVGMIAVADVALHTGKNVAGHVVREVSTPTPSSHPHIGKNFL